jgi:protein tyrosine/serine phosphatase
VNIPEDRIREALKVVLGTKMFYRIISYLSHPFLIASSLTEIPNYCVDTRNHPLLIHCKRGKVKEHDYFLACITV